MIPRRHDAADENVKNDEQPKEENGRRIGRTGLDSTQSRAMLALTAEIKRLGPEWNTSSVGG